MAGWARFALQVARGTGTHLYVLFWYVAAVPLRHAPRMQRDQACSAPRRAALAVVFLLLDMRAEGSFVLSVRAGVFQLASHGFLRRRRNTWEGPNPPPTAYPRGQPISDAERNFSLISQLMSPPGGEGHRIAGGGGGGEEKAGRELARGPERQDGAPRGVLRRACAPRLPGTAGARGFSVSPGSCRCLSVRVDHRR